MTEREQIERALVGCVLDRPELASSLNQDWFDDGRLGSVVGTVLRMQQSGQGVDVVTVLHAGGDLAMGGLLLECVEQCHSSANFPYWLAEIVEASEKDRLRRAAQKFLTALPESNGDLKGHVSDLENELAKRQPGTAETLTPKQSAGALADNLEERMRLEGRLSGLATGFYDLDAMLDGLQFGEMTVLGSRPSIGKTAIGCNIVDRICLTDGVPTLFLSLEMSASAICRRMLSARHRISLKDLKAGRFTEGDFEKFSAFDALLKRSPIYIRESFGGMGAGEAAALIRRGARRKGVKFVVLDYLQKLKADHKHEKRTYEVGESSGVITEAVRDSGVALLCLAQLSRENEKDKGRTPRLSDLADSGQIERDADNVLLLHRDRANPDKPASLIVAKQRDGETGLVRLIFEGRYCKFHSESKISDE